jgi:hypothetical protein
VGDFNRDGDVTRAGYSFWKQHYGEGAGIGLQADGNRNGIVDSADYIVWRNSYNGGTGSGTVSTAEVVTPVESAEDVTPPTPAVSNSQAAGQVIEEAPGPTAPSVFSPPAPPLLVIDVDSRIDVSAPAQPKVPPPFARFNLQPFLQQMSATATRRHLPLADDGRSRATDEALQGWNAFDPKQNLLSLRQGRSTGLSSAVEEIAVLYPVTDSDSESASFDAAFDALDDETVGRRFRSFLSGRGPL